MNTDELSDFRAWCELMLLVLKQMEAIDAMTTTVEVTS